MPTVIRTGNSTVDDVFTTFKAETRTTLDDYGIVEKTVNRTTLPMNEGLTWSEPKLSRSTAGFWQEGEPHPEASLTSSKTDITPFMSGLKIAITESHMKKANENLGAKIGQGMGQALAVFKEEQLISNFDTFTASLPGAGAAFTVGGLRAAVARIRVGGGEPYKGKDIFAILHPYQHHDLMESLGNFSSGNPTLADPGLPADVLKNYEISRVVGVTVAQTANIDADGSDDAKGAVYARQALQLVDFQMPRMRKKEDEDTGTFIFFADQEFGHGIRENAWGVEIYSDVLAPTA